MKRKLLYCLTALLSILGCTKDFDGIVLDAFEFEFSASNDPEGYVYEELNTTFSINPSRQVDDAKFFFDYRITEGEGYFLDRNGNIYEPGESELDSLNFEYSYVPIVTGTHSIAFEATDHRDNVVVSELDYEIDYAPFTALLKGGTNSYVVNRNNDLLLIMLSENTSKELDSTYIVRYSVDGGLGTIYRDSTDLEIGKELKFSKGNSEISYVPTTLGEHIISMVCTSPDGFEKTISHAFEVENITFFVSAEVVDGNGTVGDDVTVNLVLQTTDVIEEVEYEMVFYFAEDSEGSGSVSGPDGEAVASATQYPIEPGNHSFTFSSEVLGRKKMYFDISDSNNQIKRDSVVFDYSTRSFEFSGSTPNRSVGAGSPVPITFSLESEDSVENFTFSYRRENGNGSLTDQNGTPIEPTTAVTLDNESFTYTYTPTTMGDNDLLFTVTNSFGQSSEVSLNLDVNGDSTGFDIASSRDTYELQDNADITFNNGSSESYTVDYSTDNDGIVTYRGTSYSPGTSFVVDPGTSLASYQAFGEGGHVLEFSLLSDGGRTQTAVLDFTFRENLDAYVTIGSNLGGETPSVGSAVDIEFNVSGEGDYTVTYDSSNQGTFLYGGMEVEPGGTFTVSPGISGGTYTGTAAGVHELMFEFVSGTGGESSSGGTINFRDSGPSADGSVAVGNGAVSGNPAVGEGVSVDFEVSGGGTITAKFTGSSVGSFSYNGQEVPPGGSFILAEGSTSGTYTGSEEGIHELEFQIISGNGGQTSVSTVIEYGGDQDTDISFSASAQSGPFTVNTAVDISLELSGNAEYTLRYVGDKPGSLSYGGTDMAPGQTFEIPKGSSNAVYSSSEPGIHDLVFTASSTDGSVGESVTVTIELVDDGPGDSFTAEPIAMDTVNLRTETGISFSLTGTGSYSATYSSNNTGTFIYGDMEISQGQSFAIENGTSLGTYKGTDPGDHDIVFTVVSGSGERFEEDLTIIYREAAPGQLFLANGKGLRKVLNQGAEIEFNLLGDEDYVARFASSQEGYLLYRDTYIGPGEVFPISSGESSAIYVGTDDGIHTIDIEVSPFSDFFESYRQRVRFIYAAVKDFDFAVSAEREKVPIGESVVLNFDLGQTAETFRATYGNNNQGSFAYNGVELQPGDSFFIENGPSSGTYSSSQAGPHDLNFTIASINGRFAYAETRILYEDSDNAINLIAGAASPKAGVNDVVEIRFTLRGEETYTAQYSSDNTGILVYNGATVNPGESFPIDIGNSSGSYTGRASGMHNLEFVVRSVSGITSKSATAIEYD